jgi:hypothetical protein
MKMGDGGEIVAAAAVLFLSGAMPVISYYAAECRMTIRGRRR